MEKNQEVKNLKEANVVKSPKGNVKKENHIALKYNKLNNKYSEKISELKTMKKYMKKMGLRPEDISKTFFARFLDLKNNYLEMLREKKRLKQMAKNTSKKTVKQIKDISAEVKREAKVKSSHLPNSWKLLEKELNELEKKFISEQKKLIEQQKWHKERFIAFEKREPHYDQYIKELRKELTYLRTKDVDVSKIKRDIMANEDFAYKLKYSNSTTKVEELESMLNFKTNLNNKAREGK